MGCFLFYVVWFFHAVSCVSSAQLCSSTFDRISYTWNIKIQYFHFIGFFVLQSHLSSYSSHTHTWICLDSNAALNAVQHCNDRIIWWNSILCSREHCCVCLNNVFVPRPMIWMLWNSNRTTYRINVYAHQTSADIPHYFFSIAIVCVDYNRLVFSPAHSGDCARRHHFLHCYYPYACHGVHRCPNRSQLVLKINKLFENRFIPNLFVGCFVLPYPNCVPLWWALLRYLFVR